MSKNAIHLSIGAVNLAVYIGETQSERLPRPPYNNFILGKKAGNADITIEVFTKNNPDFKADKLIFDTEYSWTLHVLGGAYLYRDRMLNPPFIPLCKRGKEGDLKRGFWVKRRDVSYLRQAVIDRNFTQAKIYCSQKAVDQKGLLNWIFDVPLGQFLLANILAQERGLVLHACAVKYRGCGYVFMGGSGSGKSTLAGLWRSRPGAVVLSDERVVLRRIKNKFWIFGTPWTGSGFAFANEKAPFERLYLIEHAQDDFIKPVRAQEAMPVFLANIRLPLWDREKTQKTLSLVDEVLSSLSLFRLGFRLAPEILDLLTEYKSYFAGPLNLVLPDGVRRPELRLLSGPG